MDDDQTPWVYDAAQKCYILPRRHRLPKRERRLARQALLRWQRGD